MLLCRRQGTKPPAKQPGEGAAPEGLGDELPWQIYEIPRSREVGQSYLTSIWTTLWAAAAACVMVFKAQPQVVGGMLGVWAACTWEQAYQASE